MTSNGILKAVSPSSSRSRFSDQRPQVERRRRHAGIGSGPDLLRRTTPVNRDDYGESRGLPIDRYYIEKFLAAHAADVQGHVLDFGDDTYARKFGGNKTTKIDVLHLSADNPRATIVADLARGEEIPSGTFDCILCTQVLHRIYDIEAAVHTLHRVLKPGGVVLVTDPGIQKIDSLDLQNNEECWRFTSLCLRRLFEEVFPKCHVNVAAYGNVLAAVSFLHGFAVEDMRRQDLDCFDPDFEVSIALRAVKSPAPSMP